MRGLPKLLRNPLIVFLLVIALVLLGWSYTSPRFSRAQHVTDLLEYLFPPGSPSNPMSSGELFTTIADGANMFRITKSVETSFYERFRFDFGTIYHLEDTTWATEVGPVTCNDTGNRATLTYTEDGGFPWVNRSMTVGQAFVSEVNIIGRDQVTGKLCQTPYSGFTQRTIVLRHQGCVNLPTGVTSDDSIVLEIVSGAGSGEQFIYDHDRGWIGFNRGFEGTGAYITEQLSTKEYEPGECFEITVSPGTGAPYLIGFGTNYMAQTDHLLSKDAELGGNYVFQETLTDLTAFKGQEVPQPPNLVGEDLALVNAIVGGSEDLPAPRFPFLNTLKAINRRLTPAVFDFRINKPEKIESYSFHPVCDVKIVENETPLTPPPTPTPHPTCEGGPIPCDWCTNATTCGAVGGVFYDSCNYCREAGDGCCDVPNPLAITTFKLDAQPKAIGSIDYDMHQEWADRVADTRLTQSILVPNKSTGGNLNIIEPEKPPDEDGNRYLAGAPDGLCSIPRYKPPEAPENPADLETIYIRDETILAKINEYLGSLRDRIFTKLEDLFGLKLTATIEFIIKDNNYCIGCGDLGVQTTGEEGFVNSFLPARDFVPIDHAQSVPEKNFESSPGDIQPIETTFSKVGNIKDGWKRLYEWITPAAYQGLGFREIPTSPSLPAEPLPVASTAFYSFLGEPQSQLLKNIIDRAARTTNIPPAILAAVAWIEGGHLWSYSDAQVGADIDPINCEPNACSAAGPMQFTTGGENLDIQNCPAAKSRLDEGWTEEQIRQAWPNQWAVWGEGNVCSISGSISATSRKLKNDGGPDIPASAWAWENVLKAGTRYYGECVTKFPRLNYLTYCEFMWAALNAQ